MRPDNNIKGHVCMLIACIIWGLMAPIGKDAMNSGISGLAMVTFRATGGAVCFWIASLFTHREEVSPHDMMLFFFMALLSVVFNQCSFTIGLSLTSPVNASIVTTITPIITLIMAAIFLHEPITSKKVLGIFAGAGGALLLILGSAHATKAAEGNLGGDLLCLLAQISFACYLTIFRDLIHRYSVITIEKWMFTYAAIVIIPFSYREMATLPWATISNAVWAETAFVVVGATFFAYILMMTGQKTLRPTIVSMYNYVQPIVACLVSVAAGLGIFGLGQAIAVVLIFSGVWLVTQSKSRVEMLTEETKRNDGPD